MKLFLDSHKLIYHQKELHAWACGKCIYPIYVAISLSGTCNHKGAIFISLLVESVLLGAQRQIVLPSHVAAFHNKILFLFQKS